MYNLMINVQPTVLCFKSHKSQTNSFSNATAQIHKLYNPKITLLYNGVKTKNNPLHILIFNIM